MEWHNFGDVNFLEHGGCMVAHAWDADTLQKYPNLSSSYQVFVLSPIQDAENHVLAYLKFIDVDDWVWKMDEITDSTGCTPETDMEKACMIAEYIGLEETLDQAANQTGMYAKRDDYIITRQEAAEWMSRLGIFGGKEALSA